MRRIDVRKLCPTSHAVRAWSTFPDLFTLMYKLAIDTMRRCGCCHRCPCRDVARWRTESAAPCIPAAQWRSHCPVVADCSDIACTPSSPTLASRIRSPSVQSHTASHWASIMRDIVVRRALVLCKVHIALGPISASQTYSPALVAPLVHLVFSFSHNEVVVVVFFVAIESHYVHSVHSLLHYDVPIVHCSSISSVSSTPIDSSSQPSSPGASRCGRMQGLPKRPIAVLRAGCTPCH